MTDTAHSPSHPSPQAHRANVVLLLFALLAGPTGWIGQIWLGYGLSSHACFPRDAAGRVSPPPGWAFEKPLLLAINGGCLALILVGFAVGLGSWRRTRSEKHGGPERVLEVGEGRSRFLAQCAMLTTAGFMIATLFDTIFLLFTPTCWSFQ